MHQRLHPFPTHRGTGWHPSKQCSSKLPLCCFSCKTLPTGKEQTDVKVSPWLTVNPFNFSSLAASCFLTVSLVFPQLLVPLTATPCRIFRPWNVEGRPAFLLAICRSSVHTDTTMRWIQVRAKSATWDWLGAELAWDMWEIQVLAKISAMMNKLHLSKATFCHEYFNGTIASERTFGFLLSFDIFPTNRI